MSNNSYQILVVEDEKYRLQWFREKFIGHTVSMTKDVEEAKRMLEEYEYDYIFLDHDLTESAYQAGFSGLYDETDKTTGYEVTLFLESLPNIQPKAKIFVHSLSPVGGDRMMKALKNRDVQRVPFNILMRDLKIS